MFLRTICVHVSYHLLDTAEDSKGVVSILFIALHVQRRLLLSARHQMFLVGQCKQSLLSSFFFVRKPVCSFISKSVF